MADFKKDASELGALWSRTSANGTEYLTGEIAGQRVVCFKAKTQHAKSPTWRVLKSEPRDAKDHDQRREERATQRPSRVDDIDADIPFD